MFSPSVCSCPSGTFSEYNVFAIVIYLLHINFSNLRYLSLISSNAIFPTVEVAYVLLSLHFS